MSSWSAKPSGGYNRTSTEAKNNILCARDILVNEYGYTLQAVAGIMGNAQEESGFNPWRWQSDTYNTHNGYGLFQFTPASGYISLSRSTPNLSTSAQTEGATAEDGANQVRVFASNTLAKWVSSCWRSYWDSSTYSEAYERSKHCLNTWGNGSSITMAQFAKCTDVDDSAFIFLACFEGPAVPTTYTNRQSNARWIYDNILSGTEPPEPPEPPEPEPAPSKPPAIWLYKKLSEVHRLW